MTGRARRLRHYAFVPFLPLLWYVHDQFGQEPITDGWILLGFAAGIAIYAASTKTLFHVLCFNFLMIWFCVGTANFIITSLLWPTWEGDIIFYNRLCALFLVSYSAVVFLLTRRIDPSKIGPVTEVGIDLTQSTKISLVMIALTAALIVPKLGWLGVFGGGITDENRFDIQVSALVPRLTMAFPFLACILVYRWSRAEVRGRVVLGFIAISFFIQSLFGARFGFFQTAVSGVMFLIFAGRFDVLKRYRAALVMLVAMVLTVHLVLPNLRRVDEASDDLETLSVATSFLSMWAGEHRDAAASFYLLTNSEKEAIAENYVSSVVFPIVPSPVLGVFGFDKEGAMEGGAAYYMQRAYGIENGGIRIGGIAELFFFLGHFGVVLAGLANAIAVWLIDRVVHGRGPKSFAAVAFAAYGSIWVLYFVVSQSNMLLGSFAAFVVTYFVMRWARRFAK